MNKKFCAILLALVFLNLNGCKSKEITYVEQLIDAIGEVTLESENDIISAERALESLDENKREDIRNLDDLTKARERYEQLVIEDHAAQVIAVIDALGQITLDSGPAIERAQTAYDNAPPEVQKLVTNYSEIEKSRVALHELEIEDEARKIEAIIDTIGDVKLSSKSVELIDNAEETYESASDEVKALVKNYSKIEEARKEYHYLEVKDKAEQIEQEISEIGTVTLKSESKIKDARNKYSSADQEVKDLVSNYEILEAAEQTLWQLKADTVIELIDAIGNVTIDSQGKITAAREAYEKLDGDSKKYVSNIEKLNEAEDKLNELIEQKNMAIVNKMVVTEDKVNKVKWLEHPNMPQYYNVRSFFYPYIGRFSDDSHTWLRVKANYYGDDWIFFDTIIISIDGKNTYIFFDTFDTDRKIAYGSVAEIGDFIPDESQLEALRLIPNSQETIIRFSGDSYYYDLVLSATDKQAIGEILAAYDYLLNNQKRN